MLAIFDGHQFELSRRRTRQVVSYPYGDNFIKYITVLPSRGSKKNGPIAYVSYVSGHCENTFVPYSVNFLIVLENKDEHRAQQRITQDGKSA